MATATHILVFLSHGLAMPVDLCEMVWSALNKSYRQKHISHLLKKQYVAFALDVAQMSPSEIESELGGCEEDEIVLFAIPGTTASTTLYEAYFKYEASFEDEGSTHKCTVAYSMKTMILELPPTNVTRQMDARAWHITLKSHIVGRAFTQRVVTYLIEKFAWNSRTEETMHRNMRTIVKSDDDPLVILFGMKLYVRTTLERSVVSIYCDSSNKTTFKYSIGDNNVTMNECVVNLAESLHLELSRSMLASIPSVFEDLKQDIERKLGVRKEPLPGGTYSIYKLRDTLRDSSPKRTKK